MKKIQDFPEKNTQTTRRERKAQIYR